MQVGSAQATAEACIEWLSPCPHGTFPTLQGAVVFGILIQAIGDIFARRRTAQPPVAPETAGEPLAYKVLNVGGGSKATPIPEYFTGWKHDLLDIDARGNPDLVCDARELLSLEPGQYDAIYCSHNLEHCYRHDGRRVLQGFMHILKDEGFAEIRVPDIALVIAAVQQQQLDLDDVLYVSAAGPITVTLPLN